MEMGRAIDGNESSLLGTYQITGTMEKPQILEIPVTVRPPARALSTAASSDMADRKFVFCEKAHKSDPARWRTFERVWKKTTSVPTRHCGSIGWRWKVR